MPTVTVLYDSQTGFTEKMAEAVVEGAGSVKGVEVELLKIGTPFSISKLEATDAIILGSPVIYGNVTPMMNVLLEAIKKFTRMGKLKLSEKIGGAFGSFAFSGGWVIRELSDEMEALGIQIVTPPVSAVDGIARKQPIRLEKEIFQSCRKLGKVIAEEASTK